MTDSGPPEGYRRKYKTKGFVDQDGNVYRRFKDKRTATLGSVVAVFAIGGLAAVLPQAGVTVMVYILIGIAVVMWLLRRVIGDEGVSALAEKVGYALGRAWAKAGSR